MPESNIPEGFCQCGCGGRTIISPYSSRKENIRKGQPRRYLKYHNRTGPMAIGHPLYLTPTYTAWANMKQRGLNPGLPQAKDYVGRGISVCARWVRFANFAADMGEKPEGLTLERINNDLGYGPLNCKWATRHEQRINSRARALNPRDEAGRWAAKT